MYREGGDTGRYSAATLTPGRSCWRVRHAARVHCVQDGADYFRFVRQAILRAERSLFILGWDITAKTDLLPGETPADGPTHLDELLTFVARRRPGLDCYVLTWDYGALYALERDLFARIRLGWLTPRGVRFAFDNHHPTGGCHHQKVVVVDDRLAFCGSLDLTGHRWDRREHRLSDPGRVTPTGKPYPPYHEVQMMVEGDVAASLGELARDRWRALGTRELPAVSSRNDSLWPADVKPDLEDVDVGISRTMPGTTDEPEVRECEALFFDTIASARRSIYIENQYFTSERLAAALAARLAEADGPEVVVVSPKECQGWLEKNTMGALRETVFRRLLASDRYRRLRLVYPVTSRSADVCTFIHSKLMVADDDLLRIGSANLSSRSLGMDTECDLTVVAGGRDDVRAGINTIQARLLAEHLGLETEFVIQETQRLGSLRALIDSRSNADRTLARIELSAEEAPAVDTVKVVQTAADPAEPIAFASLWNRVMGLVMRRLAPAAPGHQRRTEFG